MSSPLPIPPHEHSHGHSHRLLGDVSTPSDTPTLPSDVDTVCGGCKNLIDHNNGSVVVAFGSVQCLNLILGMTDGAGKAGRVSSEGEGGLAQSGETLDQQRTSSTTTEGSSV